MKTVIDSIGDIAEPLREHYEERGGKFYLKLDDQPHGFVKTEDLLASNAKLVEFRDNNIRLLKEADAIKVIQSKFDGIDPVAAKEALEKVKRLGAKGVDSAEDLDTKLRAMLDAAVKPIQGELAAQKEMVAAERRRADEFLLHSKIGEVFSKEGGKVNATDFVVGLAKELFEVKDSMVVAKTGKFSTVSPGEPLTIKEWLSTTVAKDHDYTFTPSNGGGAPVIKGSQSVRPKSGQTLLTNPTPQELGANAKGIREGTVKVNFVKEDTAH